MPTGKVKFFDPKRGFGFIEVDDGGKDMFVHISAVEKAGLEGLQAGDKVSFEVATDPRSGRPAAANIGLL